VIQVLTSEGLLRYVDSRCIQRELSDAAGISEEQMDEAAHELLYMRQEDAPAVPAATTQRPPYYEHLGGYGMHELHDFNQYSLSSRPEPAVATTNSSGSGVWWWWWHRRRHRSRTSHNKAPDLRTQTSADETTMYITSV